MSNTNTGGPAFPCEVLGIDEHGEYRKPYEGMTLRDYFAAQAMTGAQIWDAVLNKKNSIFADGNGCDVLAETAYAIADAMLKARGA